MLVPDWFQKFLKSCDKIDSDAADKKPKRQPRVSGLVRVIKSETRSLLKQIVHAVDNGKMSQRNRTNLKVFHDELIVAYNDLLKPLEQ